MAESPNSIIALDKSIEDSRTKTLEQEPDATLACFSRFLKQKEEMTKVEEIKSDELNQYMCEFILNAKRKDDQDYKPSSLQGQTHITGFHTGVSITSTRFKHELIFQVKDLEVLECVVVKKF